MAFWFTSTCHRTRGGQGLANLLVRAIGLWQRRVARSRGQAAPKTGAVTFVQRFGGLVNLNVHSPLAVPDGVFVDDGTGMRFEMLPVPTHADVLAILDRIMRRIARRLANEAAAEDRDADAPDVLAQVQAEAAATWRSPADGSATVRGAERLHAWCEGFSLHAGVVIAEHDRAAHDTRRPVEPRRTSGLLVTRAARGHTARRPWPTASSRSCAPRPRRSTGSCRRSRSSRCGRPSWPAAGA